MLRNLFVAFVLVTFTCISYFSYSQTQTTPENHVGMFSLNDYNKSTTEMPEPSEYWESFESDYPYLDSAVTADIAIFYGEGHTTLVNPVVITDGFDPGDTRSIEGLYEIGNQQNMIDTLRSLGNDFILVNYNAGADYIQRNSMLIVTLLDTIQTIMSDNGTLLENPQIVVVGPSMGGLITRHAICYMEQNEMEHHVRNWISFDSPHKGANIPLGLQHWLRFFAEVAESDGAIVGLAKMNSIAAKQMLLYHHSATESGIAGPHGLRNDFVNEINVLGFPQEPRIVAFANGSGHSVNQPFEAGEKVVEYEYESLIADLTGNVWAAPQQIETRIFEGLYNTALPLDEVTEDVSVSNTLSYDNAPGGDTPTFMEIAEEDPGYGTIIALHDSHCFIPTISGLCIENTIDPEFNVSENIESIVTPFDTLYFPIENEEHVEITEQSIVDFILEVNNFAPEFSCEPITEAEVGEEYSFQVTASDNNYWNVLEYEMIEGPMWLAFDEVTNTLSGIPTVEYTGLNNVEISVSDGLLSDVLTFDIDVQNLTNINSESKYEFSVFPNPFVNQIFISFSNNEPRTIEILDVTGKSFYRLESSDSNVVIPSENIAKGMYVIKITDKGGVRKSTIVKI